jgi:protoheme ferro-lyase
MQTHWIYQFQEALPEEQAQALLKDLKPVLAEWKSHGSPLSGKSEIHAGRFLRIQVLPESGAPSGCSIDALNRNVQSLLQASQISIAEAGIIYFLQEGVFMPLHFMEIESAINSGLLNPDTLVFDVHQTEVQHIEDCVRPAGETWISRYFQVLHE